MPKYFQNFPVVKHTNQNLVDITKRAKFKSTIAENPNVYMPYTIKNDETVEELSYYYYGTVDYVWMIWLANDSLDPYKDWPMTDANLNAYIADKYKEEYVASTGDTNPTPQQVIEWTMNATIDDNILYYEAQDEDGETIQVSLETWQLASIFDQEYAGKYEWTAVRIYDAELEANENKRVIQVVNKDYAEQIAREFKRLMNG